MGGYDWKKTEMHPLYIIKEWEVKRVFFVALGVQRSSGEGKTRAKFLNATQRADRMSFTLDMTVVLSGIHQP